jgi:hypothetical protein
MNTTCYVAAIALSIGLSLGGCGHQDPDSSAAKVTSHQGKPDTAPWHGSYLATHTGRIAEDRFLV